MQRRASLVKENQRLICSRIFDEEMDLPDLANVIELDFLYGSRRQELQQAGRLMHSAYEGVVYHILMSPGELDACRKRLYGLYAKGFEIQIVES